MPLRDHTEPHRASTPLELLFDLCFVVSAAILADELAHAVSAGHGLDGAIRYSLLFVPVWWTWMLFSWFGSAFDNDDVTYRLLTLVQMLGALGIAASMPSAFHGNYVPLTLTYAAARIPLVLLWTRGARHHPAERTFAMRYAKGIAGTTVLWVALLAVPLPIRYVGFVVVILLELFVPQWAVKGGNRQAFHLGHITERYGLFTLIVLGESILAATMAIEGSFEHGVTLPLLLIGIAVLVSAFAVWWLYFDFVDGRALMSSNRVAFLWGYGHLLVFAAIGAMGAGAQVAVKAYETHEFGLGAQLAMGLPAAVCVAAMAWIRSLSIGASLFLTAVRMASAVLIVLGAVLAGPGGPAATAGVVALVMVVHAAAETVWRGLRITP
ncbi:low temperature requirement protein LtrA [Actinocrispum wychmicini]|uniref:Low temperature requirement protein LtrA n=2 Tax=Actinocrispum wychmicini TaxID=1213861 RepID=A0A4R2JDF6_9PSEU|nr:low temperature requirement protein LtrA [Actinocrispum wychmicini]